MNKKRLFLGLGSLAAMAAPMVSVISCGVGTGFSYDGDLKTKPGRQDFSKKGVVVKGKDVYFNFNESTAQAPFEPFAGKGTKASKLPSLAVAQAFEKAAGYWDEIEYTNIHDNNVLRYKDGDLITVHVGMEVEEVQEPNEEHSTRWNRLAPFEVAFQFAFHKIEDMTLSADPVENKRRHEFYKGLYPYGIKTNFLKALDLAFVRGIKKIDQAMTNATGNLTLVPWNEGGKEILQKFSTSADGDLSPAVWLQDTPAKAVTQDLLAVRKIHEGKIIFIDTSTPETDVKL